MKKFWLLTLVVALSLTVLVGCNNSNNNGGTTAVYKDGTYTGASDADDRGYVQAEITIKADKLESVKLSGYDNLGLEKTEDYPFEPYHTAITELAENMVSNNSWDVDGITQVTTTSNQAKQAAQRAMEKARVTPTVTTTYFDGTFMGVSEYSERGWTIAWVTLQDDTITEVTVISTTSKTDEDGNVSFARKDDSYPYAEYFTAIEQIPEMMVENNSTDIDVIAGATSTTEQAKAAAAQAMELAKR